MPSMRSYVAAHYIRNLTNSHCLPWLLRQQKTKISWKIAKLWPCVNYTYLVQPISTWAAHSMMIIKIEHQSQLASDLSGHILSWKAISKLGTLWVFIDLEFDSHKALEYKVGPYGLLFSWYTLYIYQKLFEGPELVILTLNQQMAPIILHIWGQERNLE